jgi:MFS superfamily sulfate permease-like transporter
LFFKYVGLFAIIGGLESLLTVNALHGLKPEEVPNKDKDLVAVGLGNMISSLFGGLPMISEVARSTANIHNGARTYWANFFHGAFILLFMVFSTYFNQIIPLSALAAMLVMVGVKLASPKVFVALKKIGPEQIWGFSVTLIGSLAIDLLWGLTLGTLTKLAVEKWSAKRQKV